jgi:mannose-1-phosphate guanylyltransferase/phosphomannomutase
MKTVIMAGGFGTRLRPLTQTLPKPMVPVANLPMLHHIINLLKRHSLTDCVSLLYFQPEEIKQYFRDGSDFGISMKYLLAEEDLGTAGSVRNAEDFYRDERVIVISGDVLTDFDLTAAIAYHEEKGAAATMVLTRLENPLAFGVVITDQEGRISRFLEKPTWGEVFSDTINTGIYILEPEVFKRIPKGEFFDFSQSLFPKMLEDGEKLYGYIADGYWRDIGNLSEYRKAHTDVLNGEVQIETTHNQVRHDQATVWISKNVHVEPSAKFVGTVILGDEVMIAAGATITNSVIGDRCTVDTQSSIVNSVIWHDTNIGKDVQISQAIVCDNVVIEDDVAINEDAVISSGVKLRKGSTVRPNCKIWPGKEIEAGATVSSSLIWGEKWNRELFTESKVSGLGNIEVTPEFAAKLGAAYGATLNRGDSVVVSRDVTAASRIFSRSLISGLLSCGVNVVDLRTLPIPVMRFELKSGKHAGGIHVRHSPSDYRMTDMIFLSPDGMDLPTRKARSIELLFAREDFRRASMDKVGQLDYPTRILESYRADFLKAVDVESIAEHEFKLVIDISHGGASEIFGGIFAALHCEVISLNAYPDPSAEAESLDHSLGQLSSIVKSVRADIGIHLSRGAEKIVVVDRNGEVISDQLLLLLVTSLFLSTYQAKKIAVPVMASMGIDQIAEQYGVGVLRVRNDHLAMMQAFKSEDVDFVGGTRGGFIFSKFQLGADGMFASVKLLEMLAKKHTDLATLRREYERYFRVRHQVPCPWSKKGQVMRLLMSHTDGKNRQLVDGARFQEDANWVWIAPDRNEAYFTVLAESERKDQAEQLAGNYRDQVLRWQE